MTDKLEVSFGRFGLSWRTTLLAGVGGTEGDLETDDGEGERKSPKAGSDTIIVVDGGPTKSD